MPETKPDANALAYWIDDYDQIVCVSTNWLDYARANGAPGLTLEAVLKRPISEFVTDNETSAFYRLLLERIRTHGQPAKLPE